MKSDISRRESDLEANSIVLSCMGDLQVCTPSPSGILTNHSTDRRLCSSSSSSNPHLSSVDAVSLGRAEEATREIIHQIQPTLISEQRRKSVTDYIQRLLRARLGSEVFPFGSVPLKTYLPDGDIDLTALGPKNEEIFSLDVHDVLQKEVKNHVAEFEVKDVKYIPSEVKLVKCLVQNIVVDISFNQLGGLCTLCFLEQVDRLIGRNHLFKRSIILIKAWCYYESRILGAHHALISSYALEILVLYIFHLFHSSLCGPLAVLYRFLEYFSKFDWENYCISIDGPVAISSLPDIVAKEPENDGGDLLLTKEFLERCMNMFCAPSSGLEKTFLQKHFNIIDPMKENNNLGRSVSKGNFYRIRSAFRYGARKLGRILQLPADRISDEVNKFFQNTLDRHGTGQRADVENPISGVHCVNNMVSIASSGMMRSKQAAEVKCEVTNIESLSPDSNGDVMNETKADYKDMLLSKVEVKNSGFKKDALATEGRRKVNIKSGGSGVKENMHIKEGGGASDSEVDDEKDQTTVGMYGVCDAGANKLCSSGCLYAGKVNHAPNLCFSPPLFENGKLDEKHVDTPKSAELPLVPGNEACPDTPWAPKEETSCTDSEACFATAFPGIQNSPFVVEDFSSGSWYPGWSNISSTDQDESTSGSTETFSSSNYLSDLSGNFDYHLKTLLYSQFYQDFIWNVPVVSPCGYNFLMEPQAALRRGFFSRINFSLHGHFPSPTPSLKDMPKPRGTGTYFPNTKYSRDRLFEGRSRNNTGKIRHTGVAEQPSPRLQVSSASNGNGYGRADFVQQPSFGKGSSHLNGIQLPPPQVEFGSLGSTQLRKSHVLERDLHQSFTASGLVSSALSSKERTPRAFQLKNDEDFPPLST